MTCQIFYEILDSVHKYRVYTGAMRKNEIVTIGRLAKAAQVNIQTVRFYERQGILKPVSRAVSGYRIYDEKSLKKLKFIIRAKKLGFSLKEINDLLGLRVRSVDTCERVRKKAQGKLTDIQRKILQLRKIEKTLKELVANCENRLILDKCPILEKMEV